MVGDTVGSLCAEPHADIEVAEKEECTDIETKGQRAGRLVAETITIVDADEVFGLGKNKGKPSLSVGANSTLGLGLCSYDQSEGWSGSALRQEHDTGRKAYMRMPCHDRGLAEGRLCGEILGCLLSVDTTHDVRFGKGLQLLGWRRGDSTVFACPRTWRYGEDVGHQAAGI